ncbi:MAG: hypothetical protein IPP72_06265 [Chitinophagaceae bacterium]|nr:hypothetical protein [Chitinophagaceae bacterium]
MKKTLLSCLAVLLFLPNLFNKEVNHTLAYNQKEKFDPRLSYINSISKLEYCADSIATVKHTGIHSYEYVEGLEAIIEERFYHGFSHFTVSENWMAAFAGRYLKEDYACKVQPEAIMQQPNAACSQQALVMMAVLRNKGISYRSVGFPHHYAMEVLIDKEWYFFDANMEPGITKQQRMLCNWQHQNDKLKQYYDGRLFNDLGFKFGIGATATIGKINEVPAQKARVFHAATGILSKILWCFPILLIFYRPRVRATLPFIVFRLQKNKTSLSLSV